MSYAIHDPVSELPPPITPSYYDGEGYSLIYRAASRADGQWVPVSFPGRAGARRCAEAIRRRHGARYEAVVHRETCFVRVIRRG